MRVEVSGVAAAISGLLVEMTDLGVQKQAVVMRSFPARAVRTGEAEL